MRNSVIVVALGLIMPLLFLQAPGLGDDLTYWQLAFEVHEDGREAWDDSSFHDLRWPVWGLCWVLQGIAGPGLIGYYGVPMFYGALGAWLVFLFGRLVFRTEIPALLAAALFLFHPLLDSIIFRPMPDLSEGVLGALAMWCWYATMTAEKRRAAWALTTGLLVALLYSNRLTGLFLIPTIGLCTLLFFPRRWPWLLLVAAAAGAAFAVEGLIYWNLTGDFLHSLHANLGARGRKGTESVALWYLPFRFFDSLWKGSPLAPVYVISAALGGVKLWRDFGRPGRVIVAWFVILYLTYSCAIQGINPVRPMLRDADRFLVGCTGPMALMSAAGWLWLVQLARRWPRSAPVLAWAQARGPLTAGAILLLLILLCGRAMLDLDYLPEFRRQVSGIAPGTKVLTHKSMRALSFLAAPGPSAQLDWTVRHWIIEATEKLEQEATEADQVWFTRKLAWLGVRKALEREEQEGRVQYASYIAEPQETWRLAEVIPREDNPDFVFWERRAPGSPAPAWVDLPLGLPVHWKKGEDRRPVITIPIEPELRGRRIYLRLQAKSPTIEAAAPLLTLKQGAKELFSYRLKPYLQPGGGADYFALEIPAEADEAVIDFDISSKTRKAELDAISVLVF